MSAISDDEDRYVSRCEKMGVKPQADLDPYCLHAKWVEAVVYGRTKDTWEEYQKTGLAKEMDNKIRVQKEKIKKLQSELYEMKKQRMTL